MRALPAKNHNLWTIWNFNGQTIYRRSELHIGHMADDQVYHHVVDCFGPRKTGKGEHRIKSVSVGLGRKLPDVSDCQFPVVSLILTFVGGKLFIRPSRAYPRPLGLPWLRKFVNTYFLISVFGEQLEVVRKLTSYAQSSFKYRYTSEVVDNRSWSKEMMKALGAGKPEREVSELPYRHSGASSAPQICYFRLRTLRMATETRHPHPSPSPHTDLKEKFCPMKHSDAVSISHKSATELVRTVPHSSHVKHSFINSRNNTRHLDVVPYRRPVEDKVKLGIISNITKTIYLIQLFLNCVLCRNKRCLSWLQSVTWAIPVHDSKIDKT